MVWGIVLEKYVGNVGIGLMDICLVSVVLVFVLLYWFVFIRGYKSIYWKIEWKLD